MAEVLLVQQGATDEEMQAKYDEGYAAGNTAGYANGVAYGQNNLSGNVVKNYFAFYGFSTRHDDAEEDGPNTSYCYGSYWVSALTVTESNITVRFNVSGRYYVHVEGAHNSNVGNINEERYVTAGTQYWWAFNYHTWTCSVVIIYLGA